jgi:hypothetical protein
LAGPQARPQAPQLASDRETSVSQPSGYWPLQSSKGAVHDARAQAPFLQAVIPFAALQAVLQLPQVAAWVIKLASQPSAYWRLQSENPAAQETTRHAPREQPALPFAAAQLVPQVPQVAAELDRSASHPSERRPLQSPHPLLQLLMRQRPEAHSGWPFGAVHATPQAPQLVRLEKVLVSQPPAYELSQSLQGATQEAIPHTPALQNGLPLATPQVLVQVPQ